MAITNNITLSYAPKHVNGQQLVSIGGVTQSIPTYSPEFYTATIHELLIFATGSTYQEALTNVLNAASASNNGHIPLPNIRTW